MQVRGNFFKKPGREEVRRGHVNVCKRGKAQGGGRTSTRFCLVAGVVSWLALMPEKSKREEGDQHRPDKEKQTQGGKIYIRGSGGV